MLQIFSSVVAIERMLRPADERDITEFKMRDEKLGRRVRLQRVLAVRRPLRICRSGLQAVQRTNRTEVAFEGRPADGGGLRVLAVRRPLLHLFLRALRVRL